MSPAGEYAELIKEEVEIVRRYWQPEGDLRIIEMLKALNEANDRFYRPATFGPSRKTRALEQRLRT